MNALIGGKCIFYKKAESKFCIQCCADARFRASIGIAECPYGLTTADVGARATFKVAFKKKGCGTCKPLVVEYPVES